jgi:hypothetical protein
MSLDFLISAVALAVAGNVALLIFLLKLPIDLTPED